MAAEPVAPNNFTYLHNLRPSRPCTAPQHTYWKGSWLYVPMSVMMKETLPPEFPQRLSLFVQLMTFCSIDDFLFSNLSTHNTIKWDNRDKEPELWSRAGVKYPDITSVPSAFEPYTQSSASKSSILTSISAYQLLRAFCHIIRYVYSNTPSL